jgi:hypothetical protein
MRSFMRALLPLGVVFCESCSVTEPAQPRLPGDCESAERTVAAQTVSTMKLPELAHEDCCALPAQTSTSYASDHDSKYCEIESYQAVTPRRVFFATHQADFQPGGGAMMTRFTVTAERERLVVPFEQFAELAGVNLAYDTGASGVVVEPARWVWLFGSSCTDEPTEISAIVDSHYLAMYYLFSRVFVEILRHEPDWLGQLSVGEVDHEALENKLREILSERPDLVEATVGMTMFGLRRFRAIPSVPGDSGLETQCDAEMVLAGILMFSVAEELSRALTIDATRAQEVRATTRILSRLTHPGWGESLSECDETSSSALDSEHSYVTGIAAYLIALSLVEWGVERARSSIGEEHGGINERQTELSTARQAVDIELASLGFPPRFTQTASRVLIDATRARVDAQLTDFSRRLEEIGSERLMSVEPKNSD